MDYSTAQLEALYREALLFAQDKQTKTAAALKIGASIGIGLSSAKMIVNSFRHMIRGERYRRSLNGPITEAFLSAIYRDYGSTGLAQSLDGLQQHIDYYESFSKGTAVTLRQIHRRYSEVLSHNEERLDGGFPNEVPGEPTQYAEGSVDQVLVNKYERSRLARQACLNAYGHSCTVCGFNFARFYGPLGHGFIQVHHLVEISSIGSKYEIDPIKDLRPVCPNCHAMLHKRVPALTIEELRSTLQAPPAPTT